MKTEKIITQEHVHSHYCGSPLSWSAVLSGALVAIGIGFLLKLFCMAIGVNLLAENASFADLAVGALLALLVVIIVTMVTAGYTAGYLGRIYTGGRNLGLLYGFLTWCLTLILSGIIAVHVGKDFSAATARIFAQNHMQNQEMSYSTGTTEAKNPAQNMQADNQTAQTKETNKVSNSAIETADKASQNIKNVGEKMNVSLPTAITAAAYAFFAFFFIGAICSCLGARWGMSHPKE